MMMLTEDEWQRLLRVGLQVTPDTNSKDLYCFRNIPASDGLTVRVLRLAQESRQDWAVFKTPERIRRRAGVNRIATDQKERSDKPLCAGDALTWPKHGTKTDTISPEEKKRKRRRSENHAKCATNKLRLRTKRRRLDTERTGNTSFVALIEGHTKTGTTVASVATERMSIDLSSQDLKNKDIVESQPICSNKGTHEDDSVRLSSPTWRLACSARSNSSECSASCRAIHEIVAAETCIDDDDDNLSNDQKKCPSSNENEVVPQSVSATASSCPLWSLLKTTSLRVCKVLDEACALSSLLEAQNYDLLWIEEDEQQTWTMFGEPSSIDMQRK